MLGLLNQKYLEVRRFSADGFRGMHKMSIVRKKWANVYEDCEYLEYGGSLGKFLDTTACVICDASVLKFSFAWGKQKSSVGYFDMCIIS